MSVTYVYEIGTDDRVDLGPNRKAIACSDVPFLLEGSLYCAGFNHSLESVQRFPYLFPARGGRVGELRLRRVQAPAQAAGRATAQATGRAPAQAAPQQQSTAAPLAPADGEWHQVDGAKVSAKRLRATGWDVEESCAPLLYIRKAPRRLREVAEPCTAA